MTPAMLLAYKMHPNWTILVSSLVPDHMLALTSVLFLRSQLTAAQEEAKNEEPAMDLSATFRQSMRLNTIGTTSS